MIHRKQTGDECQLNALAMIFDKDLLAMRHEVVNVAAQIFQKRFRTYKGAVLTGGRFWPVMDALCMKRRLPQLPRYETAYGFEKGSKPLSHLTLTEVQGKGQLTLAMSKGVYGKIACHAVAFEYGIIFDPIMPGPMSLSEYKEKMPKARFKWRYFWFKSQRMEVE